MKHLHHDEVKDEHQIKKQLLAMPILLAMLTIISTACGGNNGGAESNQPLFTDFPGYIIGNPVYSAENRVSDDGMEDDMIYTFPDGTINPRSHHKPIFMINGSFHANARSHSYNDGAVSMCAVILAFGGEVSEDGLTLSLGDTTITATPGLYGGASMYVNGKEVPSHLFFSDYEGRQLFVSFDFFPSYFGLDSGEWLLKISNNPLVWFDYPGASYREAQARNETLAWLRQTLLDDLAHIEEVKLSGVLGDDYAYADESFANAIPTIRGDIDYIRFVGMAGRYALFSIPGPMSILLVDMDTSRIFCHTSGVGYATIYEYGGNGSVLFTHYIFG
jgi:hypothetical protein